MKTAQTPETPIVLSASRRTDLVSCYPDYLCDKLAGHPPETVHTVVLWTKNPGNMITPGPLRDALSRYSQLYVHLTVTGLGGSLLEPGIPPWQQTVAMLPALVELVKDPRRISWRFDPILQAEAGGRRLSNSGLFPAIAEQVRPSGVTTCRTSWVQAYRKVLRRLERRGARLLLPGEDERRSQARELERVASRLGMTMQYCSVEGFPRSRCIDGPLLSELHPDGTACSVRKARGQRTLCGCTESRDLGWYSLKCPNGCLYCYAEPLLEEPGPAAAADLKK